jgi:hypothetical protein
MSDPATSTANNTNSSVSAGSGAPQTTEQAASQTIQRNTDPLGRVNVQGLVDSVKASSPDIQAQRDVAAATATQIEDRNVRREFVSALEDQGVARKPGFLERQWQGISGTATGIYEGGASLVSGVYGLGKLGVEGTVATAKFGYNYATDEKYRADTNTAVSQAAQTTVDATQRGLGAVKDYAADRIANPEKLAQDARTVQAAVNAGTDTVVKKADQIYDNYDKARSQAVIQGTTDELNSKIGGRALFEVGTLVVPATKLGIVGKGAEAVAEARTVVQGAEVVADANKLVKGTEVAVDVGGAVRAEALTHAADRAVVRGGDDAARVSRVEQEARAAAPTGAAAKVTAGFDSLAARRAELNLPAAGAANDTATLSRLEINGKSFDGINSGLQNPKSGITLDRVNAQTKTHAEAEAVQRAVDAGMQGQAKRAEMWVDRDPCDSCGKYGGLRSLARNLGVDELVVHSPSGTQVFTPTK